MKLLFIDSNILLNFYDFYDEDLDQLNKLADLIEAGEIKLFLTTQVLNEVKKNRDLRLKVAYEKFSNHKHEIPMPIFCKNYEEYSDIKKIHKILDKIKSKLSKKISIDIQSRQLKADFVIDLLIDKSVLIKSDKYLENAIKRHQFGRPPGKKDRSYGDEINWESLIAETTEEGDFVIVSTDGDYASAVDEYELKDYLVDEWKENKKTNDIYFYRSLSSFFTEHDIKIELKIEQEKDSLIENLINSSNFLTTHGIISKLNKHASFNDEQIKGLANALIENQQVNWIATDADVNGFYKKCFADKSDKFEPELWLQIKNFIWPSDDDQNLDDEIKKLEDKTKLEEDILYPEDVTF